MTIPESVADRLWANALADGTGCWIWQGTKTAKGYGRLDIRASEGGGYRAAHRLAYEIVKGPIPEGLVIDHLCRVHDCINPNHMEAVTNRENILRGVGPTANYARQTHCLRGHEFNEANTRKSSTGNRRLCRSCRNIVQRAYRQRLRQGVTA